MSVIDRVLRVGEGRKVKRLARVADLTNGLEDVFRALSDEELRGLTAEYRARVAEGESLEAIMPEAFAAVVRPRFGP